MSYLTVFSTMKPFDDSHIATIQSNAVNSWCKLGSDVEILLVGDESGVEEIAHQTQVHHEAFVARNEWGTPLISSIFSIAESISESPYLMYSNADIIMTSDLMLALNTVAKRYDSFLMVGQRTDLDITTMINFDGEWENELVKVARERGKFHPTGIDYFLFSRGLYPSIPEFAIGRSGWDNWMIYNVMERGIPVIDATADVMAIHQNHDYMHLPDGQHHYDLDESKRNIQLAGGEDRMYIILDSNRALIKNKIRAPKLSVVRVLRRLERALMNIHGKPNDRRWTFIRRFRRLRRKLMGG